MDDATSSVLTGAVSGFTATVPMTLVAEALHARLPRRERYPLPPREITEKVTEEAGARPHLDEPGLHALTVLAHFAYGTAAGGLYELVVPKWLGPPVVRGAAYGLAVWAGSYLGLLPALGILKPATEHPARRNALMLTAHLVWGAALGLLTDGAERKNL